MTYCLRVIIIAGNGPYFSHSFQFVCWKTQNPVSTTYGVRVHSYGVITHCRVKQVYPLIKLHLWCPRLKKDGHLRCGWGICHLFWWLFFCCIKLYKNFCRLSKQWRPWSDAELILRRLVWVYTVCQSQKYLIWTQTVVNLIRLGVLIWGYTVCKCPQNAFGQN